MTLPKMGDREILVRKFTYRTLPQYLKCKTSLMTTLTKIHKKQLIQNDALLPNITLKIFKKKTLKTFPDFSRVKSKLQRVRASLIPPVSPLKMLK